MASKLKVTVSVDEALVRELVGVSCQRGRPRSQLVEEALRRRMRLEEDLKEGYQTMAKADRATAEPHPVLAPPRGSVGGETSIQAVRVY